MLIYYLRNETIEGPYSIEELKRRKIASDTKIWYKNSSEWKRLDQVPEVYEHFLDNGIFLTDADGAFSRMGAYMKRFKWLFIWMAFHVSALILSYTQTPPFNYSGEPVPEKFWPFIKFTDAAYTKIKSNPEVWGTMVKFNGIFAYYDWSEFSVYVGGVLFVLLLYYTYKQAA